MTKKTVYLEDLADAFEMATDEWDQYLDMETGEIVSLPDPDNAWVDWEEEDEELAEEIELSDHYVRLPDQRELHEYQIMEDFAYGVQYEGVRQKLLYALHGRKPYRHFKDQVNDLGIEDAYYAYRTEAYFEKARDWCEANGIPYKRKSREK